MATYCMNCGAPGTLEATDNAFVESGEWDDAGQAYDLEANVKILVCNACQHQQISLSS